MAKSLNNTKKLKCKLKVKHFSINKNWPTWLLCWKLNIWADKTNSSPKLPESSIIK